MAAEIIPITKRIQTTRELLDKMKPALAAALPRHIGPDRMARVVLTEVLASVQRARPGTPTLLDCTHESFVGAVLQCAALGLEPGVLGQIYLIPFRNTKRGTVECQVIPGYKGLLALARRSGQILTIDAVLVHKLDRFEVRRGTLPRIVHVPYVPSDDPEDPGPGPVIAYYAVAVIRGGGTQFDYAYRPEIEAHRDRFSRAAHDGPWHTDFEAMALKTVLRRLCKFLPLSIEAQTVATLDEMHEAGLPQDLGVAWLDAPADAASPVPPTVTPSKLDAALAGRVKPETPETPDAVA